MWVKYIESYNRVVELLEILENADSIDCEEFKCSGEPFLTNFQKKALHDTIERLFDIKGDME